MTVEQNNDDIYRHIDQLEKLIEEWTLEKSSSAARDVDYDCFQCNKHVNKTALSLEEQNNYIKILQESESTFYPLCDKCAAKLFIMDGLANLMESIGKLFKT